MVTAVGFLRVSLCAVQIMSTHGFPTKGSVSQDEGNGGAHPSSRRGGANGRHAPKSYVSRPVQIGQAPSFSQLVHTDSASGSVDSSPQADYLSSASFVPIPVGYTVQVGSDASSTQSNRPETKWSVDPKIFFKEGLANTEAASSGSSLPVPRRPPAPSSGPVHSGETSNVVKEAELGNYQQKAEEYGYPDRGSAQGFASYPFANPLLPSVGGFGGYLGLYSYPYPYPVFDYRLLYGLYPPGTYNTFSKNHEKGKDHYQDVHYIKEHGPVGSDVPNTPGIPGSGQQKLYPRAL